MVEDTDSKDGQVRMNLMGKRVEYSGRTVIGPDPNLKFGEMGVPVEIAMELTIPEIVQVYNKEKLTAMVNEGKANYVIRNNEEKTKINLKYARFNMGTNLLYGDVVIKGENKVTVVNGNVQLQEGDKVERNGVLLDKVIYPSPKKQIVLNIGDEVHRHLKDGDSIILNRQPTLHKSSMLAKKIKVMPGKTFRMNLNPCAGFNADFDGDEIDLLPFW
jgi:DNA-directed RNA polymerase beta' subunit